MILTLDDRTARIEVMLFEETWLKHRELITKDALVLIEGLLRYDEFSDAWRLAARRVTELDAISNIPKSLRLKLAKESAVGWPEIERRFDSADGTRRYLLRLSDGKTVEAVWMPEAGRSTIWSGYLPLKTR